MVKDRATAEGDETQEGLAATGGDAEAAQPDGTKDIQPAPADPTEAPEASRAPESAKVGCFSLSLEQDNPTCRNPAPPKSHMLSAGRMLGHQEQLEIQKSVRRSHPILTDSSHLA